MAWLLRAGDVLAAVELQPKSWSQPIDGAAVRRAPIVVHTFKRAGPLDLAWCRDGRTEAGEPCLDVRRIGGLAPRRVGRPQLAGGAVVVAEPGAFERWNLKVGDRLEIREV
jgi:hypothetical protein